MKKTSILFFTCLLFLGGRATAQLFAVQHDTVYQNATADFTVINNINNLTAVKDTLQWKVVVNTWAADWIPSLGICDFCECKSSSQVWPTNIQQCGYDPGWGDFHITGDLTSVSTPGPYILRVRINRKNNPNDTAWQTYIIGKTPASVAGVKDMNTGASLYPNPATDRLNVVYDAAAEIKNVAIYSIIGKQMSMFTVTDNNSASLNIENIPSGIYFIKLMNAHGDVFATRKFIKQ